MKRRGFTLIELLIALAIISILAAMLFPVFARARESARKTTCLSGVVQLGTALQMYAADWHGALPPKDNEWSPIFPYVMNADVFHCATDPKQVTVTGSPAAPGGAIIGYSSYVYRSGLTNDGPATEVVAFDRRIWHLGGRNVTFLDGHGKWFAAAAFWRMASDRLLALDPAFQELRPNQQQEAREGGEITGRVPWR